MYDIYGMPRSISLGRQGEQSARTIEIDCAKMLADYPGARLTLTQRRAPGETSRIVKTELTDAGVLKWSPDGSATAVAGLGRIEITATVNDKVAKSVVVATSIAPSITPPDADVQNSWVKDVLDASDAAKGAMIAAQDSATSAANSAASAEASATAAEKSAQAAAGSAETSGEYANAAAESASAAAGSMDAAKQSAEEAAQSADAASASALSAESSASEAGAYAQAAAGSATDADASKRAAAGSASASASSASAASTSASNAAKSASAASGSASAAAESKTGAETAAKSAQTQAANSAASATAAEASATAAEASAAAAAESASAAAESAQSAADAAKTEVVKIIQDDKIKTDATWSSQKIVDQLYPEISASGNPVVIGNALEGYPMSIKASWKPMQEGEGDPYPAGGSNNILDLATWTDKTTNGITFKREGNGIHVTGTATANATSNIIAITDIKPGMYYGWKTTSGLSQQLVIKKASTGNNLWQGINDTLPAKVEEGDAGQYWYLNVLSGATIDYVIYPQIYKSDTPPTKFWPYANIRPIKGRESVKVTVNDTEHTLTLPETICGGEVDAETREGQKEWHNLTLNGTENWIIAQTKDYYAWFARADIPTSLGGTQGLSSHYKYIGNTAGIKSMHVQSNGAVVAWHLTDEYATVNEWKAYLAAQYAAGTPVRVCYQLATPEHFTVTGGGRIDALAGTNTITTDADSVEVKTRAASEKWTVVDAAQAAKMDYIAMMADVDMDALAADDADDTTGAETADDSAGDTTDIDASADAASDAEEGKTDGKPEV